MAYCEIRGNIFNSKAKTLVNTVNCVGVMGKGIALEFKRRYPNMFSAYKKDCENKILEPGRLYYYPTTDILIINVTTKKDWKDPSRIEWIESALKQFEFDYSLKGVTSIATPIWGVESGKLEPASVRNLMRLSFQSLSNIDIELYDFDPNASDPLFERLKIIVKSPNSVELLKGFGLQNNKIKDMVNEIKNEHIRSMFMLSESGLVGEKSIGKLYVHLSQHSEKENKTRPTLFE